MSAPGAPRLYALLGNPVAHTLSPALHRAAFRAGERDATYGALRVKAGEVAAVMRALARQGGGNVTLPHKERAAETLDEPSRAVRATGSCNCFWGTPEGALVGDNTDVEGFLGAVPKVLPDGLAGARVLLLGAGGAARAVLHGALRAGVERIEVLNRTRSRAERMVRETETSGSRTERRRVRVLPDPGGVEGPYDLAVNATSLGLEEGDPSPLELEGRRVRAVLDLVYARDGRGGTAWVRRARERGIPAEDGLEMLVLQAVASQRRWGTEGPLREAVRRAARASRAPAGDRSGGVGA